MLSRVYKNLIKNFSTSSSPTILPQVCIVGSGPAGFYTAQHILKKHPDAQVDIYEQLPVPFGLVRYGVAPDHPEVKNCINSFTETAKNERFSFIGNVTVGTDITLDQLKEAYHAVVLCYGSSADKELGISGESLPNVISARSFVGWYNGLPEDVNLNVNLDVEDAIVIGQGNVAIDVARILLRSVDDLKKTDIPEPVLEKLSKSRIKTVTMVGRRRVQDAAFTVKEVREMINLNNCRPNFRKEDFEHLSSLIPDAPRQKKRLWELLYKTSCEPTADQLDKWNKATRNWKLRFLLSPTEIIPNESDTGVRGIRCTVNRIENAAAVSTDETEIINCGLVLRSIGYHGTPIDPSVTFNAKVDAISNVNGKVTDVPGFYTSGWIATGPIGVLLSTMQSSFTTGEVILSDFNSGKIPLTVKEGKRKIIQILAQKKIFPVSFGNWCLINRFEIEEGTVLGKPREKITSIPKMIEIAQKDQI